MKLSRPTLLALLEDLIRHASKSGETDFAIDLSRTLEHYDRTMRWREV